MKHKPAIARIVAVVGLLALSVGIGVRPAEAVTPVLVAPERVYTAIDAVGRTSMKVHIEAWAQRFRTHLREKVTDGTFTFVAIGDDGRPRPLPPA